MGVYRGVQPTSLIKDVYFSQVSLLMHFDGPNESTTFTDNSSNSFTVTPNGNVSISTTQSKFNGTSGYFDGNADYLTFPTNNALSFGTGDFTVEFWVYLNQIQNTAFYDTLPIGGSASRDNGFMFYMQSDGKLNVFSLGGDRGASSNALVANTWYHLALVRSGTRFKYYINGTEDPSVVQFSLTATNNTAVIGRSGDAASYYLNGYMDELRVTKGRARYSSNFTPLSISFPNS